MKVVFFTSNLSGGGAERTIAYVSSYFAQHGNDVTILIDSSSVFYDVDNAIKLVMLDIPSVPHNILERVKNIYLRFTEINKYINRENPDIVFCMIPTDAKYLLILHRIKKFKLITSERNNPEMVKNKKLVRLKNKIFQESDGIVFQTERAKAFFSYNIQAKGKVIHNAVGNDIAYKISASENKRKTVAAIGRLHTQKNYPLLLKAFKTVLESYPDYCLEIYGKGPEENHLRKLSKELGINDSVVFCGQQKDALSRIADACCYVLSSDYEGMPNSLMEAMAIGLPCISTDCPNGPAELIDNEINGLLVPIKDDGALSNAIIKFIQNTEFANSCAQNAKKLLLDHSIEKIALDYLNFVKEIQNE